MDFLLLGPFEVCDHGIPVELDNRRQERCLLAILLLELGHVVPTHRLADLLWDGRPPASGRSAIQTYIGRLRDSMEPRDVRIRTSGDGYLIEPGEHTVDVLRFRTAVQEAAGVTDPAERVQVLDAALRLWRGPLLADLADDRLRDRLAGGLDELYMSGVELLAESRLTVGQADRVVTDLAPLVEQNPTREKSAALLIRALYRCERQADALAVFRRTRDVLVNTLGVEPGSILRTLHEQILRNDPALGSPAAPIHAVQVRGHWLPWAISGHPALDFCNTYAGWRGPPLPKGEWLRSYDVLAIWGGYADLVDRETVGHLVREAQRRPDDARAVLDEARTFRRHLYDCLTDAADGTAFAAVAQYVNPAAREAVFTRDDVGLGRWSLPQSVGLRFPLHAVARSAAELLSDPRRFTVCACSAADCGWLFLNPSGRRKWCSLATCGHSDESALSQAV
ncbi:MAG TPA: BTAD domain-containing putative transcriptional regulator [Jiangellaceae bacterium]